MMHFSSAIRCLRVGREGGSDDGLVTDGCRLESVPPLWREVAEEEDELFRLAEEFDPLLFQKFMLN